MSIANISGIFNTIRLLLFLPVDYFITSSRIRSHFFEIKPGTLNAKLRELKKKELVEVRLKKNLKRAGDDRQEYRLTKEGVRKREELVNIGLRVLKDNILEISEEKTTSKREHTEGSRLGVIDDFLVEFGYECVEIVKDNVLKELQVILKRMLISYFKE